MRLRHVVGRGVNGAVFGVDDAPPALGLGAPERREHGRKTIPHAGAVRHLVETVGSRYRAEPLGLEQDIEAWIAGHDPSVAGGTGRQWSPNLSNCPTMAGRLP